MKKSLINEEGEIQLYKTDREKGTLIGGFYFILLFYFNQFLRIVSADNLVASALELSAK